MFSSTVESDDIAIQNDGKLIVAGNGVYYPGGSVITYYPEIIRFTPDGSVDSTFGDIGRIKNIIAQDRYQIVNMKLQSNGNIIVTGYYDTGTFATKMFMASCIANVNTAVPSFTRPNSFIILYPNPHLWYLHPRRSNSQQQNHNTRHQHHGENSGQYPVRL